MSEAAPDECHFPACGAAEGFSGWTLEVFLGEPESYASLRPICGQASWFGFVKDACSRFNLIDNHRLGFFKELVELIIPSEWCMYQV